MPETSPVFGQKKSPRGRVRINNKDAMIKKTTAGAAILLRRIINEER
jgi:hypothetical protein